MVITKNSTRYQLFLRTRIVLLLLFVVSVGAQVNAQTFQSTSSYPMAQQSYQAIEVNQAGSYRAYESTIYEPFTAASPSSNSNDAPANISGRRNADDDGFGGNSDGGNQADSYPLGEAWSLLIFAAIGAGVIFIKQRKTLKAKA